MMGYQESLIGKSNESDFQSFYKTVCAIGTDRLISEIGIEIVSIITIKKSFPKIYSNQMVNKGEKFFYVCGERSGMRDANNFATKMISVNIIFIECIDVETYFPKLNEEGYGENSFIKIEPMTW